MQYASAELSLTQLTHQRYTTISGIRSLTFFRRKNKIEFDRGPLQNKIQNRQRTPLSITCDSWSNPKSNYKGLTSNIRRSKNIYRNIRSNEKLRFSDYWQLRLRLGVTKRN